MKNLKCFILGAVSIILLLPILESITDIACGWLETLKAINTKKVLRLNKEIEDLQEELEPIQTQAIGFQVDSEEYCEEDDWEEEDRKVGFI